MTIPTPRKEVRKMAMPGFGGKASLQEGRRLYQMTANTLVRIPVATVVGMVADGMGEEEILKAYPDLEREDVQ
jgi:hypothetical protein